MHLEDFPKRVAEAFSFLLSEFGCAIVEPSLEEALPEKYKDCIVVFKNATTGVTLKYEVIEQLPTIFLTDLLNTDRQRRTYNLGVLLRIRAPNLDPLRGIKRLPI